MVSAYMLAFAAVLITAGSFGDLLGRKRIFCCGIAAFGLASLAAGAAQDPGQLIAARVVQGAAAAAMVPQLLGTYRVIFDRAERGKAFGMYGAIIGFSSALGLIAGGALTDADILGLGWRAIFVINVPIAVAALVASARVVPETREPQAGRPDLGGPRCSRARLLPSRARCWRAAARDGRRGSGCSAPPGLQLSSPCSRSRIAVSMRASRRCFAPGCFGSPPSRPAWSSSSRPSPGFRASS